MNPIQVWLKSTPYPTTIEQWWMDRLKAHYGSTVDADVLDRIRPTVKELSDRFTIERDTGLGTYKDDRLIDLAYGLFFFPQSFVRAQLPILEALCYRGLELPDHPIRILDLGAGQCPSSLGIAYLLRRLGCTQPIHITAQDHVGAAVGNARDLIRRLPDTLPDVEVEIRQETLELEKTPAAMGDGNWDFIVLGFVINELPQYSPLTVAEWVERLGKGLSDSGQLLILEPSLQTTSQRLQRLRDTLLEQDNALHLQGPCLHSDTCPLLKEGKFWCHEVRDWTPNESMEYINRKLFRDIKTLKFSYLLFGKSAPTGPAPDFKQFRLISPFSEMKGRFLFRGCATDGQLHNFDLQTRGLKKSAIKAFKKEQARGDLLYVDNPERKNDEAPWRIASAKDLHLQEFTLPQHFTSSSS